MKKTFSFDTELHKIKSIARSLWMGCERGEGELEIDGQGRFDQSRFSQETEAIGQHTPRIGEDRPKLRLTDTPVSERVPSAGRTLNSDSTPQFLFSQETDISSALKKSSNQKAQSRVTAVAQNQIAKILNAVRVDEDSEF